MATTNSSGALTSGRGYRAYGNYRRGGDLPTDYRFTGQKLDVSGLVYMNARYYDPILGQFISPDTLVPDATNLLDYNRYGYARGNPMKFSDPSGHCATLSSGEADLDGDGECWQLAYQIYGLSSRESFAADWQISGERWLQEIATQGFADAGYLQPFADRYQTEWAREMGLPVDKVVWHEPPRQPVFPVCETWDCPAIALDIGSLALSVGGDALLAGCTIATSGGCLGIAFSVKGVDAAVSFGSLLYTANQYYSLGDASDLDLAIALTGIVSFIPGVGEAADIVSLGWDIGDPFIDDEGRWPPKVAR